MRSDLSHDELSSVFWPSPSSEEDVRNRVWRRTRRIRAQRLVPAAAAVMLVLAAVVPMAVRNGDEPSSLRTAGVGEHVGDDSTAGESEEAGTSARESRQDPSTPPVTFNGVEVPVPGSDGKVHVLPPPSPKPAAGKAGPLLVDPVGDARYEGQSASGEGAHAALDIVSVDPACAADTFRVVVRIDDLTKPLPPDRFGSKAVEAVYRPFLEHARGSVAFTVTRNLTTGSVGVTGAASWFAEPGVVGRTEPIHGVQARVDEGAGTIVVESSFAAVAAAEGKLGSDGTAGFRRGTPVSRVFLDTTAFFEPRNHVQLTAKADDAEWLSMQSTYRMCD